MTKKSCFNAIVLLMAATLPALTGCDKDSTSGDGGPSLTITAGDEYTIIKAGGEFTISYELAEAGTSGEVSAFCLEDWVSEISCDVPGSISFSVSPNETGSDRTAVLTVSYDYGSGNSVQDQVKLVQSATGFDHEVNAGYILGLYYGDEFSFGGERNFFTILSDQDLEAETVGGGNFYVLDMFAPAGDLEDMTLPTGTYVLGGSSQSVTEAMTFSSDVSCYMVDANGADTGAAFTDGTVTVSTGENGYVIEATLTDANGETHHVVYTGPAEYQDDRNGASDPDVPRIETPLDVNAGIGAAAYAGRSGDVMKVIFQFTDMERTADDMLIAPGTLLRAEAYLPYDGNGVIQTGTYTVSSRDNGQSFTVIPGEVAYPSIVGSYASYWSEEAVTPEYGIIKSGTMTVSGSAAEYTIVCDFTTDDGISVKSTYTGTIEMTNLPGDPISTLDGDYALDLTGATAKGDFYGDTYGTGGGHWAVQISGPKDRFMLEVIDSEASFDDGITSGTYTAAGTYPAIGNYIPGYIDSESRLSGTIYYGNIVNGAANDFAPATSGDLVITNNGNSSYTVSFEVLDDKGNTLTGTWTGNITMTDVSDYTDTGSSVSAYSVTAAHCAGKEQESFFDPGLKVVCPGASPFRKTAR